MTCIVKVSLPKFNENIFQSRRQLLCKPCWDGSKSSIEREATLYLRQVTSGHKNVNIPSFVPAMPPDKVRDYVLHEFCLCQCRSYNGILCLACKKQHLAEAQLTEAHCTKPECTVLITLENYGGSRCRWCELPCGPATRIERREIFRMRRKSTIEHVAAVAAVESSAVDSANELTYDDLCRILWNPHPRNLDDAATLQPLFERSSDEQMVERFFGEYDAEEARGRNQARWRLLREAADPFWRRRQGSFTDQRPSENTTGVHPVDMKWLSRDKSVRRSKPLIGEGQVPKSLALFRPLNAEEQRPQVERGESKVESIPENEKGEEETLYDGDSDAGTLKDGKGSGKGKVLAEESDDDDDTETVASMGSTLCEGGETNTETVEQNAVSSLPPQYGSVVPTEADRDWALFCAKGF